MKRTPHSRWVRGTGGPKSAELNALQGMWFEGAPGRQAGQFFGQGIADFVDRDSRDKRRALAMSLWKE